LITHGKGIHSAKGAPVVPGNTLSSTVRTAR
jgi:hypothetical protein